MRALVATLPLRVHTEHAKPGRLAARRVPPLSQEQGRDPRDRLYPLLARRGTAVTDCGRGPLAYAPPASGSEFAPSGALMGCARSERPRRADAALTRRGLPTSAIRWRRASGAVWRESSKRSSASVGADAPFRGKGIARPEQPREPKQSWRAQAPHAWMSAIATAHQVCWAADSEQAQSRLAWARAVSRDR